jgi:hypothetical protein
LGLLGPIDDIQASIQGRVSEFLAARTKLNEMMKSPILTIADRARELLAIQAVLEAELQTTLATIERVKADVYTMSDIASAVAFYPSMEKQIRDVGELWAEYTGLGESAKPATNWLLFGALGLLGYWLFIGRKRG